MVSKHSGDEINHIVDSIVGFSLNVVTSMCI